MIKKILNKLAKKIDNFLDKDSGFDKKIALEPLNASLHFKYAVHALRVHRPYLAFAELKTAEFLEVSDKNLTKYKDKIVSSMPSQERMNHNQYFRYKSLATELNSRSTKKSFSVLDVGGG
jgi:hypothetical protein